MRCLVRCLTDVEPASPDHQPRSSGESRDLALQVCIPTWRILVCYDLRRMLSLASFRTGEKLCNDYVTKVESSRPHQDNVPSLRTLLSSRQSCQERLGKVICDRRGDVEGKLTRRVGCHSCIIRQRFRSINSTLRVQHIYSAY